MKQVTLLLFTALFFTNLIAQNEGARLSANFKHSSIVGYLGSSTTPSHLRNAPIPDNVPLKNAYFIYQPGYQKLWFSGGGFDLSFATPFMNNKAHQFSFGYETYTTRHQEHAVTTANPSLVLNKNYLGDHTIQYYQFSQGVDIYTLAYSRIFSTSTTKRLSTEIQPGIYAGYIKEVYSVAYYNDNRIKTSTVETQRYSSVLTLDNGFATGLNTTARINYLPFRNTLYKRSGLGLFIQATPSVNFLFMNKDHLSHFDFRLGWGISYII